MIKGRWVQSILWIPTLGENDMIFPIQLLYFKPQVTSITLFVAEYQKMYIFAPINVNFDPFFLHFGLFCFVCVISSTATNTNDRLRIKVDFLTAAPSLFYTRACSTQA